MALAEHSDFLWVGSVIEFDQEFIGIILHSMTSNYLNRLLNLHSTNQTKLHILIKEY